MRVSILGAGVIGGIISSQLVESEHEIHLHVRGENGALLQLQGITLGGIQAGIIPPEKFLITFDEFDIPPSLKHQSGIILITSKAYQIESLIPIARYLLQPGGLVVCCSNGLGHYEMLCQAFGIHSVCIGVTTLAGYRSVGHELMWVNHGMFKFAPATMDNPNVVQLLDMFKKCHFTVEQTDDVLELMWEKALLNLCINPLAALAGVTNGELLSPSLFTTCMAVYQEIRMVGSHYGVAIQDELIFESLLRTVLEQTTHNECSMLQDVKHGRRTEIDELNGYIVQLAERLGLTAPLNQLLTALIRACHP